MLGKSLGKILRDAVDQIYLPSSVNRTQEPGAVQTVMVLDISGSMALKGYSSTRLNAVKDAAVRLVSERNKIAAASDIGLVAFHSIALPICPLTSCKDRGRLEGAIRGLTAEGGTNIAAGLSAALELFKQKEQRSVRREIVLLSDGVSNTTDDPIQIANHLKEYGCTIHTFGIGEGDSFDESMLRRLASVDDHGNTLYSFIPDRSGLLRHFGAIGGLTR
jgi:Mg-chelatase subunit ChlD